MAATSFEIKETILSLPKKSETDVYHTELNIVSWFGKEPKLISVDGLMTTRK